MIRSVPDLIGKTGLVNCVECQGDKFSGGKRVLFWFFPDGLRGNT